MKYSDAVSSQGAELTKAQSQAQESGDTVEAASKQIEEEKKKSSSYEALIERTQHCSNRIQMKRH